MNHKPRLDALAISQFADLRDALASDGLPHEDLGVEDGRFYCLRLDDEVLGFVGLQGRGNDLLLRSMWVRPDRRRLGTGSQLLAAIEREAVVTGCRTLHLLTTTASAFFQRHGYVARARHGAPPDIAASTEFAVQCPASATYLVKELRNRI